MTDVRRSPALVGIVLTLLGAGGLVAFAHATADPPVEAPPPAAPTSLEAPDRDAEPEAVLHLASGRVITGRLVSRADDEIILRIGGIATPFKRAEIDRLEILPPVLDRYAQMRAAIDDADLPSLLVLVEWLRVRECYPEALRELDHILTIEPGNPQALRERTLVQQLQRLRDGSGSPAEQPAPRRRPARVDFPLLSPEDINLLKVYEINLADPPRMRIERETIESLIRDYAHSDLIPTSKEGRDALFRQSPERILDLMFRLRAREYYNRVRVLDQPESMRHFRDNVHAAWLINACATDRCHGGTEAGRLVLTNRSRNAEPAVYTNFLILERATLADGTPLINYDQPARSPLLHMALVRERSLYPHPDTPATRAWRPVFTSQKDRRYEQAVEWIRSMYRPRPDYPITYTPPSGRSLAVDAANEPRDRAPETSDPTTDDAPSPEPVPDAPNPEPR